MFDLFVKWATTLAPLVAQGILTVQGLAGVNHPTLAGQVAGWLLSGAIAKAAHAAHSE